MPRIALLAPYLPAPARTGGRIRIHRFAAALAERAEVELFAQAGPREALAARNASELAVYARHHTGRQIVPGVPWSALPSRVLRGSPRALSRALLSAHCAAPFDVVVAEHCHAARFAGVLGVPWVLDEHNIERRYVAAKLGSSRGEGRELEKLAAWQASTWRNANGVVCVTEEDAREVERISGRTPVVIPNGADTGRIPFILPSSRAGADVLFVGLMDHPPNVRAARWLARDVMPLVWANVPSARLVLCGANPSREVRALRSGRVLVTGAVDSVVPYLSTARAYACALKEGAGSSLKVVEALASGVPLVATRVAVRGFSLVSPETYRNAEDERAFAARLVEILRGSVDDDAARRGRDIAERHEWRELARRFADLVLSTDRGALAPRGSLRDRSPAALRAGSLRSRSSASL